MISMKSDEETDFDPPSKTRLKQEATELQELGKRLSSYSTAVLKKLPVTSVLISAIEEFNRLPNSHGARRRQLQFIGKLMRDVDYADVIKAIDDLESGHLKKQKKPGAAKVLSASILEYGDEEINKALEKYPQLERQTLRQLQREYNRATEASRDKFKSKLENYLRSQIDD